MESGTSRSIFLEKAAKMIRIENLNIVFNPGTQDENHALKNINLTINKGDFIVVVGSNGAGKSTLFNAISGNLKVSGGHIFFDDENREITNEPEYKRAKYMGRIFQNPLLGTAGKMTIQDNMMICSKKGFKGLKISLTSQMKEHFKKELMRLNMGLENRLSDNVSQLSGGQRQALTLLMSVMSRPSLLLLDEHTAALDPANAAIVMDLTKHFAVEYGLTVMMVTHQMKHALTYGNRLIMMDKGEIISDLSGKEKESLTLDDIIEKFRKIKNLSDVLALQ